MAYIALSSYLDDGEHDTIFLDEPEAYLGKKMISDLIVKKLLLLSREKRIIMTTHSSSLGVNTLPYNYIYKEVENQNYNTYVGYVNEKNPTLKSIEDSSTTKNERNLREQILNHFEGSEESFIFRKDVYGK